MENTLDQTKAEIEKFLLDAKQRGTKDVRHSFFFTFLPPLTPEVFQKIDEYNRNEIEQLEYHLEISYKYADRTEFSIFDLDTSEPDIVPPVIMEITQWFFEKVYSLGMSTKDERELR